MTPFQPYGKTIAFTADTTPPTAVQAPTFNNVRSMELLLTNVGTVTVFIAISSISSADAVAKAVVPTGTATATVPLLAGTQVVYTLATGNTVLYVTGVTGSGTAIVYVTPGYGY